MIWSRSSRYVRGVLWVRDFDLGVCAGVSVEQKSIGAPRLEDVVPLRTPSKTHIIPLPEHPIELEVQYISTL